MKKKTYMIPSLQVVSVNAIQMLAYSVPVDPGQEVNVNFTKDSGDWDIWGNGSDDDYDEYDEY